MMNWVQAREWVNEAFVKELTKHLGQACKELSEGKEAKDIEGFLEYYALVLGVLGERGAQSAEFLEALQKRTTKDGTVDAITFGLTLARIDPGKRAVALKRLCEGLPEIRKHAGRGVYLYCLNFPQLLFDATVSDQLAQMIEQSDGNLAEEAAVILTIGGLSARDATPRLLKCIRGSAPAERRALAAAVLGSIADYAQMAQVEAALKAEKSEKVQRNLRVAIENSKTFKIPTERIFDTSR